MIESLGIALVAGALLGRRVARRRGSHRPRALELVIEPPRPACCSWCCPSGHFRGTMPPSYSTRCRCTGGCGHPVREKGASFPNPAPWDDPRFAPDRARERALLEGTTEGRVEIARRAYVQPPPRSSAPIDMPTPGPGVRRG